MASKSRTEAVEMPEMHKPILGQGAEGRFWPKVNKDGPIWNETPCWVWTAAKTWGYGSFRIGGKGSLMAKAHRVAYELLVGPVPDGLDLDHLCRNRACVNPAHLEPVTRQTNLLRGHGLTAAHASATHCPQGHPYDLMNVIHGTQWGGKGIHRGCRACLRGYYYKVSKPARQRRAKEMRQSNYSLQAGA